MSKNVKDSFVVLSDFHSYEYPLDKIKNYYLNEYENVFILGDATDRGKDFQGSNGIYILLEIKKLTEMYPNRVHYIPGNHDQFLYEYGVLNSKTSRFLLLENGGEKTMRELNGLMEDDKDELLNWLGKQPLQMTHEFCGQKYAFAHAFFDMELYKENPNLSLNDALKSDNIRRRVKEILWFRKEKDEYISSKVPSKDYIEVIGHTPYETRWNISLDLKNAEGDTVKVVCVDGGIAYGDKMLKYDGGYGARVTFNIEHKDTSPKEEENIIIPKNSHKPNK